MNATLDDAYNLGYDAQRCGIRQSANPFHSGAQPDLYDAWKAGWHDRAAYDAPRRVTENTLTVYLAQGNRATRRGKTAAASKFARFRPQSR